MKNVLLVIFIFFSALCSAQVDSSGTAEDSLYANVDSDTVPFHYPYYGNRIPPFMGIAAGYEGFGNNCIEGGLIFHIGDYWSSNGATGLILGGALTYKHSLDNDLSALELEVGLYAPFTMGFGLSENFYNGSRTTAFRPFIGTSWYHLQVIAGYNFFRKDDALYQPEHFTVKIRYALPVVRILRGTTSNPGNNY